jgi:hypothetical protein
VAVIAITLPACFNCSRAHGGIPVRLHPHPGHVPLERVGEPFVANQQHPLVRVVESDVEALQHAVSQVAVARDHAAGVLVLAVREGGDDAGEGEWPRSRLSIID